MVLPRPTALRGFAPARLYRSTARTTLRSRLQTVARRGYASEGGHAHASSSDVPWLISAVAVTLPSCYFLWPEPSHADAHGAHGGHEEHEEEHAEGGEEGSDESKEEPQEEPKEESEEAPKDDKSDEAPKEDAAPAEESEDDAPKEESKDDAPKEESEESQDKGDAQDEQSEDSKSKSSKPDRTEPELTSNRKVPGVQFKGKTSAGDENNEMQDLRKREPDSKGAFKKRIDSAYQKNLGEGPDKDENGKFTGATSRAVSDDHGSIDRKQMGLTNTPTRHSSLIHEDPEKSKKGEGTPETAKSMGTVAHDRPAR